MSREALCDTISKLSGKYSRPGRPVKDKARRQIVGEEQQRERWILHFKELLNRPVPPNPPNILPEAEDLDIVCGTPTRDDIRKAIRQQRNGKAAEPDNIPCKVPKADIETTVDMLYTLFKKIWEEEDQRYHLTGKRDTLSICQRKVILAAAQSSEGSRFWLSQGLCSPG